MEERPIILVVDDETDIFYLVSKIFKELNIDFVQAETINEGLMAIIKTPSIALVLLDNHLPDGLGIEFIKRFKEKKRSVVMMTAFDTRYDRKYAEAQGADDFIGKPFTKQQMTTVITKILFDPSG